MIRKGGAGNSRHIGDLYRSEEAACFEVEMPASGKVVIKSQFGNDIGTQVRRCIIISRVELYAQSSIEGSRKNDFRALSGELLRVLYRHSPDKLIVEVIGHTELRGTSKVVPYLVVRIFVESGENISRNGRDADTVGGKQTPDLPAQKLPLAALQVQPEMAQAIRVAVGRNKHVARIVAIEIELDEACNVILTVFGSSLQVEPRMLSSRTKLGEMALNRVAEWDGPEVGSRNVACIRAAEDVFKVHVAAWCKVCAANAERKR